MKSRISKEIPIMYARSFRCAYGCGERYEIRSNKYSLLFEVECAIQQSWMALHQACYCKVLTFKLGVGHE